MNEDWSKVIEFRIRQTQTKVDICGISKWVICLQHCKHYEINKKKMPFDRQKQVFYQFKKRFGNFPASWKNKPRVAMKLPDFFLIPFCHLRITLSIPPFDFWIFEKSEWVWSLIPGSKKKSHKTYRYSFHRIRI